MKNQYYKKKQIRKNLNKFSLIFMKNGKKKSFNKYLKKAFLQKHHKKNIQSKINTFFLSSKNPIILVKNKSSLEYKEQIQQTLKYLLTKKDQQKYYYKLLKTILNNKIIYKDIWNEIFNITQVEDSKIQQEKKKTLNTLTKFWKQYKKRIFYKQKKFYSLKYKKEVNLNSSIVLYINVSTNHIIPLKKYQKFLLITLKSIIKVPYTLTIMTSPMKRKLYTVLKSPHVYKKSRDQYEKRLYKVVYKLTLMNINKNSIKFNVLWQNLKNLFIILEKKYPIHIGYKIQF